MELKRHIILNVNPENYYSSRFPEWTGQNVKCPFHDDGSPSLSLNLKNGGSKCHATSCEKSFGNIVHFESELKQISERDAALALYQEFIRPIISPKLYRKYLQSTQKRIKIANRIAKAGSIAEKLFIGWSEENLRVTFPIINPWNKLVNIRFYQPKDYRKGNHPKIFSYKRGYGGCEFWPWYCMSEYDRSKPWYLMASERETLMAIALGLQAFCSTAGEGHFPKYPDYQEFFNGLKICLVYDKDKAGEEAETKAIEYFRGNQLLKPEFNFEAGQDFAEWVFDNNPTLEDIENLNVVSLSDSLPLAVKINNNFLSKIKAKGDLKGKKELPGVFHVSDISNNAEVLNKIIEVHGIVAAKSSVTYSLPYKFRISNNDNSREIVVEPGRMLLRFIKCKDETIHSIVRGLANMEEGKVVPLEYVTATEVEIIPLAAVEETVTYAMQRCFFLGDKIESNIAYRMKVIPTNEMRTQQTIGLILSIEPVFRLLDTFQLDSSAYADLVESFRDEGDVWDKLAVIAKSIAENYSYISNREDWHIVAFLSWCSPLMWRFPKEKELQRGWINTLCLGDTETGKSKLCRALQRITNSGMFVSAENATFVGLIGGAIKTGSDQFMLKWGKIPLADRQLVIIEELSGLSIKEIANMSDVRSSGIARLDKGGLSAETNARTRLIFLSNVRNTKSSLAEYLSGVTAIQELIGHGEDIARFDLIITLTDSEVSTNTINQLSIEKSVKQIPEKDFENLIKFIWSLKPEQILFTDEAYAEILFVTRTLSDIYHPSVPIFKGGSGRYKVGRIAAAIACATFNYNPVNKQIIVEKRHVDCASKLLQILYNKPSFGYLEYSDRMYDRSSIGNLEELNTGFRITIPSRIRSKVADSLIHAEKFTRDELQAVAGITNHLADQLIGLMLRERAVRKGEANVWEITGAGKKWLKKFLK